MSEQETLFLFKPAQAKQFLQQNLTLLAQPEGETITARYKRLHIHHALDGVLPEHVVIVFTEPPHDHFVPVREARLQSLELESEDDSVLYTLRLGPLLPLAAFEEGDDWFRTLRPTPHALVFTADAPIPQRTMLAPRSRWQALVHHLSSPAYAAPSPYERALFAFVHPLATVEGHFLGQEEGLWLNQGYRQTVSVLAPGLAPEEMGEGQVQLDYPRTVAGVTPHTRLQKGEVTLHIQPLQVQPTPWLITLSTRATEAHAGPIYLTMPPVLQAVVGAVRPKDPFQRLHLFEWLSTKLSARDQLRLLDRFLLPRADDAPPDPLLLLARAALLKKEGQATEAVDTLLQIPLEVQSDEMLVLLFESAVAARRQLSFMPVLDHISNWEHEPHVRRLVQATTELSEEIALPLAYHLCRLAPIYANLVWQEIGPAIQQLRYRFALVRFLQGDQAMQPRGYLRLPPNEQYAYLARLAEPDRLTDEQLDYLVEAGLESSAPSGLAPFFLAWMERHLSHPTRDEVIRVRERFARAQAWLTTHQEEEAVLQLMEAYKRTGQGEQALWLAIERVDEARRQGDFEHAEQWLREARNSVSALPPDNRSAVLGLIKDEDDQIKQARHQMTATFAPRYGHDPGLAPILKLYNIDCVDAFWADLEDVLQSNEHIVRQLIQRLDQLQQFAQQTGSSNTNIHSLSALQGNVSRMELTDSARLVFKKLGRSIRLIALYPNHDAYDEAIKQRYELMNRIQRG